MTNATTGGGNGAAPVGTEGAAPAPEWLLPTLVETVPCGGCNGTGRLRTTGDSGQLRPRRVCSQCFGYGFRAPKPIRAERAAQGSAPVGQGVSG